MDKTTRYTRAPLYTLTTVYCDLGRNWVWRVMGCDLAGLRDRVGRMDSRLVYCELRGEDGELILSQGDAAVGGLLIAALLR